MRRARGDTASRRDGESQPGEQGWKGRRGRNAEGEGSLAICLDVEGKTVDGFNYG